MGKLWLEGFDGKVTYAQMLHDGSEIQFKGLHNWQKKLADIPEDALPLDLPMVQPDVEVPVVELFLK